MPRFDIQGREGSLVLALWEDGREYRFDTWPYETTNPVEVKLLRSYLQAVELHELVLVIPEPEPEPPAPKPLPLPKKRREEV